MKLLLDFSGGLPSAAAIKSAGYDGVISYVKKENPASGVAYMTAPYYQSLTAAGLDVNFVYENYDRLAPINTGYNGGTHDATWAIGDLQSRGIQPRNIFMAHDIWEALSGAQIQACRDYQRGAHGVLGDVAGAYAFAYLLQYFIADGTTNFTWLTGSSSSKFSGLNAYQRNYGQVTVEGIPCDVSEGLTTDYGQLPNPFPPPPPPPVKGKKMIVVKPATSGRGPYLLFNGEKSFTFTGSTTSSQLATVANLPFVKFDDADYDHVLSLSVD